MRERRVLLVTLSSLMVVVGGVAFRAGASDDGARAAAPVVLPAPAGLRPMRLPGADRQLGGLIWGAECRVPPDRGLAFGGEDPASQDGSPHTRVLEGGAWKSIRADLEAANRLQALAVRAARRAAARTSGSVRGGA